MSLGDSPHQTQPVTVDRGWMSGATSLTIMRVAHGLAGLDAASVRCSLVIGTSDPLQNPCGERAEVFCKASGGRG